MRVGFLIFAALVAGLAASIVPVLAAVQITPLSTTERKAQGLFRVVRISSPDITRCAIDGDWLNTNLPKYVARRYLGLTLHAELSSPKTSRGPADIIDPGHNYPKAFCNATSFKAFEIDQLKDFDQKKSVLTVQGNVMETMPTGLLRSYSVPIFNKHYRKAIVIIRRSNSLFMRMGGSIKRLPPSVDEVVYVYVWKRHHWHLEAHEIIGMS